MYVRFNLGGAQNISCNKYYHQEGYRNVRHLYQYLSYYQIVCDFGALVNGRGQVRGAVAAPRPA